MHTAPEVTISNLLQALSILFKVGSLTEPGPMMVAIKSQIFSRISHDTNKGQVDKTQFGKRTGPGQKLPDFH